MTTIAHSKEGLKGPVTPVTSIFIELGRQLSPGWGQSQPSQVVEFQQGLVEGLVNLHVLLLGTGQGLCEGKQHVRKGRHTRGDGMRQTDLEGVGGRGRHKHLGV